MEYLGFQRYGFQTVFGFTDSIFIKHCCNASDTNSNKQITDFLINCEQELNVNIEHKNRFTYTIIFNKKNRYIAWTGKGEDRPILKNLDGLSRRYPRWIKQQIEIIATHLITKPDGDVTHLIRQAFEDLDYGRFNPKDLQFTEQLDKNPNQYPDDKKIRVKVLSLELRANKGELVYWYESLANKRGYSTKVKDISITKYKEILWDKIEDILDIAGYNIDSIKATLLHTHEIYS